MIVLGGCHPIARICVIVVVSIIMTIRTVVQLIISSRGRIIIRISSNVMRSGRIYVKCNSRGNEFPVNYYSWCVAMGDGRNLGLSPKEMPGLILNFFRKC
jgi:hypothetical protein